MRLDRVRSCISPPFGTVGATRRNSLPAAICRHLWPSVDCRSPISILGLIVALSCAGGCQTFAGRSLPPIEPPAPSSPVNVEHTVEEFTYAMGSADMRSSILDGKLLGSEIMHAWQERGYVGEAKFVKKGAFSGTADYHLTWSGSQRNEASFWAQVLSGLTLLMAPYTVTQHYDLRCVLEDVRSGATYSASVQESDRSQVEIFLLLTLPLAWRGHDTTVRAMGDHLYDQLRRQGAFQREASPSPRPSDLGRAPTARAPLAALP